MGPVWEANHVWLIFVLTVTWTAYPTFLGSLASTLGAALFVAGLGIILRGASYALRSGAREREMRAIDGVLGAASLLAPFALGAAAGGIAAERVPVGNASGGLFSSWLNPVGIAVGVLSVAFCGYLAAVYLTADAGRHDDLELAEAFRLRALVAGVAAGALAIVALVVVHADARSLYRGLTHGAALIVAIASVLAGAATLGLVWKRRSEWSRYGAAAAVALVIAAWALARWPVLLPGLTIDRAAAPHDTLVAVVVAVLAGGAILFPSLALLFSLTLGGHLRSGAPASDPDRSGPVTDAAARFSDGLRARVAVALLIAGIGLLNVAEAGWAHAIGVVCLLAFVVTGFAAIVPRALAAEE
jgi:cytochrome d ubiquinol oxidase subunit II